MTQRIEDPEGRGVTSRRRKQKPQMILTSPLEVFGGSEQARIHHDPQAGCSHGDRVNVVLRFFSQGDLSARSLTSRGMLRGGASRFPCRWVSFDLFPPRRKVHIGSPFDMDDPPIRVPSGEGKRRQVDRPMEPDPYSRTSGDVSPMDGWIPGSIHLPRGYSRRNTAWVPGWSLGGLVSDQVPFPEGLGSFMVTRPPWVRAAWRYLSSLLPRQWGTSTPLKSSCEDLSLRPFLQRPRGGSFGIGVRDESKGQILCAQ